MEYKVVSVLCAGFIIINGKIIDICRDNCLTCGIELFYKKIIKIKYN